MRIVLVGNSDAVASPARFCASALRTLGHDLEVASPRRGAGEPKLVLPPSRDVDLLLYIDDFERYEIPRDYHPSAYWCLDTHKPYDNYAYRRKYSEQFDFVFTSHRPGLPGSRWLPFAADPETHRPLNRPKTYDVCFIGNPFLGPRARTLGALHARYRDRMFVGFVPHHEMVELYNRSRLVFNLSVRGDLNARVFEPLACGTCVVTDDDPQIGVSDLLRPGHEVVTWRYRPDLVEVLGMATDALRFRNPHDRQRLVALAGALHWRNGVLKLLEVGFHDRDLAPLFSAIDGLLRDDAERERIASNGHRAVLERHTYVHRMQTLMEHVFGSATQGSKWRLSDGSAGGQCEGSAPPSTEASYA